MRDEDRGKIRNREYAIQINDFSGLRFGKITPTDIDGFIDFGNEVFIFIEVKHGLAMPPIGQLLALERLCDACQAGGVTSYVIIARSDIPDGDVDVAILPVVQYRYRKKWIRPRRKTSVREAIDIIRKKLEMF